MKPHEDRDLDQEIVDNLTHERRPVELRHLCIVIFTDRSWPQMLEDGTSQRVRQRCLALCTEGKLAPYQEHRIQLASR